MAVKHYPYPITIYVNKIPLKYYNRNTELPEVTMKQRFAHKYFMLPV